ncbi:MAG: type II secretion system F family protein [Thermoplasmatota archaeon]
MRPFDRAAYKLFGGAARRASGFNPHLRQALLRAHLPLRPDAYMASAYLTMLLAFVGTAVPLLALIVAQVTGVVAVPGRIYLFLVPVPFVVTLMVYLLVLILPDVQALSRGRRINAKLPYAINYLSTMASAGATPQALFAGLARQKVYGPVAEDAALITRDLQVLGLDILSALGKATERSSSPRMQDLWQGIVTTLSSGGDLKTYLNNKAEQFLLENRQDQHRFLDSLGVLAESFVTVVVAAPLFLIIILSVLTSFGGSVQDSLTLGYSLVFLLMPLSQFGFAWAISTMTPEA